MLMLLRTTFDTRAVVTKVRIRKQSVSDHIDEVVLFVHNLLKMECKRRDFMITECESRL